MNIEFGNLNTSISCTCVENWHYIQSHVTCKCQLFFIYSLDFVSSVHFSHCKATQNRIEIERVRGTLVCSPAQMQMQGSFHNVGSKVPHLKEWSAPFSCLQIVFILDFDFCQLVTCSRNFYYSVDSINWQPAEGIVELCPLVY